MSVRTLEELGQLLESSSAESTRTNKILNDEVIPRLDRLDATVGAAGLNGHTALLKKFLDEYAAGQTRAQAWSVVRADVGKRFGFLSQPKSWAKALLYAVLGGLGWKIASGISVIHLPFIH